ncbi:hypothetical protein B0H11DRAFT_2260317 [Mycena galericulata]|nr:hypothetical protein B0H11DRAFT_2260317 [Mycena galericulata]
MPSMYGAKSSRRARTRLAIQCIRAIALTSAKPVACDGKVGTGMRGERERDGNTGVERHAKGDGRGSSVARHSDSKSPIPPSSSAEAGASDTDVDTAYAAGFQARQFTFSPPRSTDASSTTKSGASAYSVLRPCHARSKLPVLNAREITLARSTDVNEISLGPPCSTGPSLTIKARAGGGGHGRCNPEVRDYVAGAPPSCSLRSFSGPPRLTAFTMANVRAVDLGVELREY